MAKSVTCGQADSDWWRVNSFSKMRRAQQTALDGRHYVALMNKMLSEVTANAGDFTHPLIEKKKRESAP